MFRLLTIAIMIIIVSPILAPLKNSYAGPISCGAPVIVSPGSYIEPVKIKEVIKETIVAPVAVPVVVPATVFQYLPAVAPPVPAMVQQPMPQPARPQPAQPSTAELDRLIRTRLEAIIREQVQQGGQTSDDMPPPITFDDVAGTPQQPKGVVDMAKLVPMLKANCARCHGNGKKAGDVKIFDDAGNYAPSVPLEELIASITNGTMPKNRKLSAEELKSIKDAAGLN